MPPNRSSSGNLTEHLNRQDMEIILEVNKKAIEIETEVATQNEEIISTLNITKQTVKDLVTTTDKIQKQTEDLSKDIFKLQVLFVTGLLSLVVQVIQFFLKN
jgi:hypothetical protein